MCIRDRSGTAHTTAKKNVTILHGYAGRTPAGKPRRIVLRFLVSPLEIVGADRVEGIRIARNELVQDESGAIRPHATDVEELISCGLVFRSIGYRGTALDGVPFDERRAVIPNDRGRVLGARGEPVPGVFAVGWIKRGPTGIIGTNKRDAQETVDNVLADLEAGRLLQPSDPDRDSLEELLDERKPGHVTYEGWAAIDSHERGAGEPHGRPRVKLTTAEALLEAARERVG